MADLRIGSWLALQALGAVCKSDDAAVFNNGVSIEQRFDEPQRPASPEVTGEAFSSLLVHKEHIGPIMAAASAISFEEFDGQRRDTPLLATLGCVPRRWH